MLFAKQNKGIKVANAYTTKKQLNNQHRNINSKSYKTQHLITYTDQETIYGT